MNPVEAVTLRTLLFVVAPTCVAIGDVKVLVRVHCDTAQLVDGRHSGQAAVSAVALSAAGRDVIHITRLRCNARVFESDQIGCGRAANEEDLDLRAAGDIGEEDIAASVDGRGTRLDLRLGSRAPVAGRVESDGAVAEAVAVVGQRRSGLRDGALARAAGKGIDIAHLRHQVGDIGVRSHNCGGQRGAAVVEHAQGEVVVVADVEIAERVRRNAVWST